MAKLTEKKLCDICERIVKVKRLQNGSGITEDIFKGIKKAKAVVKNLSPIGKKLVKDLVKAYNQGKVSLEEAINQATPIVQNLLASKSGGAFTTGLRVATVSSGPLTIHPPQSNSKMINRVAPRNLPEGTTTSQGGEGYGSGAVLAGEGYGRGAVLAGEVGRGYGKGARIAGESKIYGKGSIVAKHSGAGKKTNPWLVHLKAFRASNPSMSYKDAMSKAKLTYKKK
jgi:hypothetical protein